MQASPGLFHYELEVPPLLFSKGQAQPRPQGFSLKKMGGAFSRPTQFLRERPWGRGWLMLMGQVINQFLPEFHIKVQSIFPFSDLY